MNNRRHSGNSHTDIIEFKDSRVFRKTFQNRSTQYFTEYLINRYLYNLNPCFVAKIIGYDHNNYFIDYRLHQPSPTSDSYARKYLDLISTIHYLSSRESNSIRLFASQPLNDPDTISRCVYNRIHAFQGYNTKNATIDQRSSIFLGIITYSLSTHSMKDICTPN